MVGEYTRNRIWRSLWNANSMVRYYQAMRERYRLWNQWTLTVLAVLGTGSLTTLLEWSPSWLQACLGILVAGVTVWVMLADFAAKSAVAHSISERCGDVAHELESLFSAAYTGRIEEDQAAEHLEREMKALHRITSKAGEGKLITNDSVNEKAHKDASEEMQGYVYGT